MNFGLPTPIVKPLRRRIPDAPGRAEDPHRSGALYFQRRTGADGVGSEPQCAPRARCLIDLSQSFAPIATGGVASSPWFWPELEEEGTQGLPWEIARWA
jgi:hypothetical protein